MDAHGGVDVWIHVFLIPALVGGEWSASCPSRFTPGDKAPCTRCIERILHRTTPRPGTPLSFMNGHLKELVLKSRLCNVTVFSKIQLTFTCFYIK
jgi:hypothetical protein